MADDNEKRLRDYWIAWRRFEARATASTECDEARADTLEKAVSEAASLYAPAAQALWRGANEAEVFAAAMCRYLSILTQKAVSRGACAVAIAVHFFVTLGAALGGTPVEEIQSALLAACWWGAPTVWAGGVAWGAHRCRRLFRDGVETVPWGAAFEMAIRCVFGTWVPGAALFLGLGVLHGVVWPGFFDATIWATVALVLCVRHGGEWRRQVAARPLNVRSRLPKRASTPVRPETVTPTGSRTVTGGVPRCGYPDSAACRAVPKNRGATGPDAPPTYRTDDRDTSGRGNG